MLRNSHDVLIDSTVVPFRKDLSVRHTILESHDVFTAPGAIKKVVLNAASSYPDDCLLAHTGCHEHGDHRSNTAEELDPPKCLS